MGKLSRGLIGAVAGFGEGLSMLGQDQIKKNAELARALREEAMQLRSDERKFGFERGENEKTRDLTVSEGKLNREAKTEDQKRELESKERIASDIAELKTLIATTSNETKRQQLQNQLDMKTAELNNKSEIADMKMSVAQGLLGVAQQRADTYGDKVAAGKESSPTEQAKARGAAIAEAQPYIDSGDIETAKTILNPFNLTLQKYDKTPKKTGFFSDTPAEIGYHIVPVSSGKSTPTEVSTSASPTPAPGGLKSDLDSLLQKGKGGASATTSPNAQGAISSSMPKTEQLPADLPGSVNDLNSIVKSLPPEQNGIYIEPFPWERSKSIGEVVKGAAGQTQSTTSRDSRFGEDNLTKAIRLKTGETDLNKLNTISEQLKYIYKGKLSEARIAELILTGKIFGKENQPGA